MTEIDNVIDSIQSPATTGRAIPAEVMGAPAVFGYIAGNQWLTYEPYLHARPDLAAKGLVLPVSLTYAVPRGIKRCVYDIESGGGQVENIAAFAARVDRSEPFYLYTFASGGSNLLSWARRFGFVQGHDFFYWAAHVGRGRHLCAPDVCGYPRADGTQYEFAASFDRSVFNDYALPHAIPPHPDPYAIFPTDTGAHSLANHGDERLTVEQADGALEHPQRYRNYLKGQLRFELKGYRDRCFILAKFLPPDYKRPNPHPAWMDDRKLGIRWQAINDRMKKIDEIP